jgi:hypothetical protein
MPRSRQRTVRLAVLLPPLLFLTVFGYWRFLESDAFRALVERILQRALAGDVTIGSHEVESLAFKRIRLSDLSVEFTSLGGPSGVRFEAKEATASASIILGVGPLEEVVMRDAEASFRGPASLIARLDLLARPRRASRVGRIRIEQMAVSFATGGRTFRVGGMGWTFDFSGGSLRLSADVDPLRIEGVRSKGLEEEAPSISFDVEVSGATSFAEATEADRSLGEGGPKVVLRELKTQGRSGWQAEGKMEADLACAVPEFRGRVDLWDLPVSRVYPPLPGVEISPQAHVERTICFEGPADRLRVEVTTDVKGLTYADGKLGLRAEGVTLRLKGTGCYDLLEILRKLLANEEREPKETDDARSDVQDR